MIILRILISQNKRCFIIFKKKQPQVLVQAVCFHCANYNEYYRHPDEPPLCKWCGILLDVEE